MRQDADRAKARELFRQMSLRGKAEHIFRYYWFYMVAGVAAVIVAAAFVVTWRTNEATRGFVYVGIQEEYYSALEPAVNGMAREAQWSEGINFAAFPGVAAQDGMSGIQLVLYITADEIDVAVCDQQTMQAIREDETIPCSVVALKDTMLGQRVNLKKDLYVICFEQTGRGEKARQFAEILTAAAS